LASQDEISTPKDHATKRGPLSYARFDET